MSSDWVYDHATSQYVRWSSSRKCWIDTKGRAARAPQETSTEPSAPPTSSSRAAASGWSATTLGRTITASPSTSGSSSVPIESSFARLNISSTAPYATSTRSAVGAAVTAAYSTTARDTKTGAETTWDFSETRQYRDPSTESTRPLNIKRIRQPEFRKGGGGGKGPPSYKVNPDPLRDYRPGRIIEVLLVPPEQNQTSSTFTPSPDLPAERGIRLRRFVIARQNPEGRNGYEALAIKTYNGRGVAGPGLIKSHHAIIHTSVPAPHPDDDELPPRPAERGIIEGGMQTPPIRAVSWDRAQALDPKSRLDYMDRYEFDYGGNNISLWGKIHESSEVPFFTQYNHVWSMVYGVVAGPGPGIGYGTRVGVVGVGAAPSSATSTTGTVTANTSGGGVPRTGGPSYSSGYSGTTAPSGTAQPPRPANLPAVSTGATPTNTRGILSVSQMQTLLLNYQNYARTHSLTVPGMNLTQQQLQGLAQNPHARQTFLQKIKDQWKEEEGEEEEEDEEEEEEDDDDEEEESDDERRR